MVEFFHTDCGHPIGCTGSKADLQAERLRKTALDFALDMATALKTGKFCQRSNSMLSIVVDDAIGEVPDEFPNPRVETIENAYRMFNVELGVGFGLSANVDIDLPSSQ